MILQRATVEASGSRLRYFATRKQATRLPAWSEPSSPGLPSCFCLVSRGSSRGGLPKLRTQLPCAAYVQLRLSIVRCKKSFSILTDLNCAQRKRGVGERKLGSHSAAKESVQVFSSLEIQHANHLVVPGTLGPRRVPCRAIARAIGRLDRISSRGLQRVS